MCLPVRCSSCCDSDARVPVVCFTRQTGRAAPLLFSDLKPLPVARPGPGANLKTLRLTPAARARACHDASGTQPRGFKVGSPPPTRILDAAARADSESESKIIHIENHFHLLFQAPDHTGHDTTVVRIIRVKLDDHTTRPQAQAVPSKTRRRCECRCTQGVANLPPTISQCVAPRARHLPRPRASNLNRRHQCPAAPSAPSKLAGAQGPLSHPDLERATQAAT